MDILGTWSLESWRRYEADGSTVDPLGSSPSGMLMYAADGGMAVMMAAAERPELGTDDPVGGSEEERAAAYSSCLAYVGHYRIEGDSIVHELETSLFPNWSGTQQVRPFVVDGERLVLKVLDENERPTNEISWSRHSRGQKDSGQSASILSASPAGKE